MTKAKKLISVLMVALMALAFSGMTAFAASLSVTSQKPEGSTDNTTYTYYQILKADIGENAVAYFVEDEAQATELTNTGIFTVTKVVSGDYWTVESTENDGAVVAEKLAAMDLTKFTVTGTLKAGETKTVAPGYYLVLSSLGTKLAVATFNDVTIEEKNAYPSITKTVDTETAAIGDEVTFTVTVTIPGSADKKDIVIEDTADAGLTLDTAVTVTGADGFTSATITDGKITIPAETVAKNVGKDVTLTYKATVNDAIITDATKAVNSATNTVVLKYADFTSKEATATVSTYAVKVLKVDENDAALDGAQFTLWDAATEGNQITVTKKDGVYYVDPAGSDVIEAGTATIVGLDAKSYYLQEEVAPTGYNKLAAREAANVSTDDITEVKVVNKAGVQLPETGAFGTTMFYVIGVLAILGAGVFMVTNKRIAKEEF